MNAGGLYIQANLSLTKNLSGDWRLTVTVGHATEYIDVSLEEDVKTLENLGIPKEE